MYCQKCGSKMEGSYCIKCGFNASTNSMPNNNVYKVVDNGGF